MTDINSGFGILPSKYMLSQNFPNPFNPETSIEYSIPEAGLVSIRVYNVLGSELKTLVNGYKARGRYKITFNSAGLPSGVYFYRMETDSFSDIKKMIILK